MKEINALSGPVAELLQSDICTLFYRLAQEMPGQQILLNLGREKILVCQDSVSAQSVLRGNPDNFHKNFAAFSSFFGASRLTTDGEQWRKLRKIGQPIIARVEAAEIIVETEYYYTQAANRILAAAARSPILTIDHFIDHAAASVVMKSVLGLDLAGLPYSFYAQMRRVLTYCGKASMNASSLYPYQRERSDVDRIFAEIRVIINGLLIQGRKVSRGAHASLQAFYSALPSDAELFGEFCTLLFAGFDTTASTLCWALLLLANKPSLQEQLRRELQEITAGGPITSDLSSSSETLLAFINETFRMFPAVPILGRIAVADDGVGATHFRAGQKILLSIIGLHHDSTIWPEPSKMDIGRFPNGNPSSDMRKHFLPFSAGPRVCGGSKFALTEISVAIATLLRHLQLAPADQRPVRFQWGASMRHRDGIGLVVTTNPLDGGRS